MIAGGDPANQTPAPEPEPEPEPQPEPEPEPQGPEKVSYNFTSFSADGQTEYATGVAETTGEKKTFGGQEYIEVEVKENSIPEWVGRKFYIIATAAADGETKYPLYDAEGNEAGILVTIAPLADVGQGGGEDTDLDG